MRIVAIETSEVPYHYCWIDYPKDAQKCSLLERVGITANYTCPFRRKGGHSCMDMSRLKPNQACRKAEVIR